MIKLTRVYNKRFSQLKASEYLKKIQGFKFLSSNYSDDFKINVNELIHQKSGAKVYHLQTNDQDNTFATIFKTFPSDSKGCPHILQHLACCGSTKFPIRDPFFNMLKRSVNTYMNAWTGEDFTCYPFSSTNPKDWKNLFNVYTDMAFKPLLNQLDFMQEGWRFEINQKGHKQIKGIVFNQMKGAYQNAQRQLMMALNQGLYAETGYRHDSGGKPQQIVNLTYNQLLKMYNYFYHPSNASLFFYGNNNISQSLLKISQQYLNNYQFNPQYNHSGQITPKLPQSKFKTIHSSSAQCNSISLFYYLKNIQHFTASQTITFKILQYLILQKNTSYVYQKFIQSNIAQTLGYGGFNQSKLASFGLTLKGVNEEYNEKQFYQDFNQLLNKIMNEGINQKRLMEFLHQLEIEIKTPKQNYGIKMLGDCLNYMNHRLPLINHLTPLKFIDQAKQTLLNKDKLKQFINKNFIQNKHFIVVRQLVTNEQSAEQKKIESLINVPEQQIKQKQQQLKQRQSQPQDANVLPKLNIQDLIPRKRVYSNLIQSLTTKSCKQLKYHHIALQNDIIFYRFVFNFKNLSPQINDKLGLWSYLINKGLSTKSFNYKQLSSTLGEYTSGLSTSTQIGNKQSINIVMSISCLKRNKQKLFQIMQEILFDYKYQEENVKNLLRAYENQAIESLTDSPIRECIDQCGSGLNYQAKLFNKYQKTKVGLELVKNQKINQLKELNQLLLKAESITLIEHSNEKATKLPNFFKRFQSEQTKKFQSNLFVPNFLNKAVTHNFDVNFCSQQYLGPDYLSLPHAQLSIACQFLQQQYLHPQIREKGGAYGARSNIRQSGNICLFSYMDPQCIKTFKVFDESVQKLKHLTQIPQQKLQEIKINLVGQLQRIRIPQDQCIGSILKQYKPQQFEQFIIFIKEADSKSIIQTCRKYFDQNKKSRCIFGKQVPQGFKEEKISSFI